MCHLPSFSLIFSLMVGDESRRKQSMQLSRVAFQIPAHFCSRCPMSSHPERRSGSRLQHQVLGKQLRVSPVFPPMPSSKPQGPLSHLYVESPSVWSDSHRTAWAHPCVEDGPIGSLCREDRQLSSNNSPFLLPGGALVGSPWSSV